MILNLRGSNGAGKSHVGHSLLNEFRDGVTEVVVEANTKYNDNKKKEKVIGYILPGDLFVAGRYEATCGGAEGIPMKLLGEFVEEKSREHKHVFFEGMFVSLVMHRYVDLAAKVELEGQHFVAAFLNTPMEVTLERIYARNGGKTINAEAITNNFNRIHGRIVGRMSELGVDCRYVEWTRAYDNVKEILVEGGWKP